MNPHGIQLRRAMDGAFTLIEMLAVIAIMTILLAVIVPMGLGKGSSVLTSEGHNIGDQIAMARQIAMTRNKDMEIRFYEYPAGAVPEQAKWAVQLWMIDAEKGEVAPIGRRMALSDEVVILKDDPTYSPIFPALPTGSDPSPAKGNWYALRFRPNGRIATPLDNRNNFLTLRLRRDAGKTTFNFYTLQFNRLTGIVSSYRP